MPQFDTFSFLSQLFWVFLAFLVFYLLLCFYLLPALASILKIRKRKLAQLSPNVDNAPIIDTSFLTLTKASMDNINNRVVLDSSQFINTSSITKNLSILSLKYESFREFNASVFTRVQISYLLYV